MNDKFISTLRLLALGVLATLGVVASLAAAQTAGPAIESPPSPAREPGTGSAKACFYQPPRNVPAEQRRVAVRFWLELEDRDGAQRGKVVSAGRSFRAGDRLSFRVAANADAYLYVVFDTSLGDRLILFPSYQAGLDAHVPAYQTKMLPHLALDRNPGIDRIVIVASPQPVAEIDAIVNNHRESDSIRLTAEENRVFSKFQRDCAAKTSDGSVPGALLRETIASGPQTGEYCGQRAPGFHAPMLISIPIDHGP